MWEEHTDVKLTVPDTPISVESNVTEYITSSAVILEPVKLIPAPV